MLKKYLISTIISFILLSSVAIAREIKEVPHWKKSTVSVYIPKGENDNAANMLRSAFGRWQVESYGHLKFKYLEKGPADINIVFSDNASSSDTPIASTKITSSNNEITKAEISIATKNKDYKTFSNSYISKVMLHEVGHALGIPTNTTKKSSIMYAPVTESQKLMKIDTRKLFSISEWDYGKKNLK